MPVNFISVKCPECNASLSFEEDREKAFCSYCGTQILLSNENEYTYRHVDEADMRRAETERLIYLKELEIAEKENERSHKSRSTAFKVAGIVAVVGAVSEIIEPFNLFGTFMIVIALYIALFTLISNEKQKKKQRMQRAVASNEVMITESMCHCEDENFNGVMALFRSAGFSNVQAVPLNDLSIFTAKKNGQVEEVTINGDDDFEEGDIFKKSAHVVITYHSTK